MNGRRLMALAGVLLVVGCQQSRTQHYYEEHEADRGNTIATCTQSDRQVQPSDECAAALRAQRVANIKKDAGIR
jgi:predicted alpha/beta hydrolase family esterase